MGRNRDVANHKRDGAMLALLTAPTIAAAAELAGVSVRTLYRYLADPAFKLDLAGLEADVIDHATRKLIAAQGDAIDVVTGIMNDANAPAVVRLRAAVAVLDSLVRLRELRNVEARLIEIERWMNEQGEPEKNRSNRADG